MDKIIVYEVFDRVLGRIIALYVKAAGSPEPQDTAQFVYLEAERR